MAKRAIFGTVRRLPSGRYQARYLSPAGERRTAGVHDTAKLARGALAEVQTDLNRGEWRDRRGGEKYFGAFAETELELLDGVLAPNSVSSLRSAFRKHLAVLHRKRLREIDAQVVRWWFEQYMPTVGAGPTARRNAYFALSRFMRAAVEYGHIPTSPCRIKGVARDVSEPRPFFDLEDVSRIIDAIDAPEVRAALWVKLGTHLRLGEVVGLNAGDVLQDGTRLRVERQVDATTAQLRPTKTSSTRTTVMLAPARTALAEYLRDQPRMLPSAPLFVGPMGGRLSRSRIRVQWNRARDLVGLPDAHIHDLRHTGLTEVARHATTREVMARAGHSTTAAAMRYQHATSERDEQIVAAVDARMSNSATA